MNVYAPYLDNIETVGISFYGSKQNTIAGNEKLVSTVSDRTIRNRKRGNKISSYARQNAKTYKELHSYLLKMDSESPAFTYAINLRAKLQGCCSHSLVREHAEPKTYEYIGAHTCKHKMCHVCNYERSRALRRKYLKYFQQNEFVDKKTGEVFTRDDMDFMHLTLTVPHTDAQGFRGKRWYSDELITEFNYMRKKSFWQEAVFAGEFGIEVTKNNSGLHIHMHCLLLVHKGVQNRNRLHREILLNWNMQTQCNSLRVEFTPEQKAAIKKGNKMLTDADVDSLYANGSTMVGLESLFVYSAAKKSKTDKWNADLGKWKHYVDAGDESQLMQGVMECIKYHFEPLCMNKADGSYDFDLMCEILPAIQGKPLYRKFGNFHGVKQLNLIDNDIEDLQQTLEETANNEILHPETNEPAISYNYLVVSARNIYYDRSNNYQPHIKYLTPKTYLHGVTLAQAMMQVTFKGIDEGIEIRKRQGVELQLHKYDQPEYKENFLN